MMRYNQKNRAAIDAGDQAREMMHKMIQELSKQHIILLNFSEVISTSDKHHTMCQ